MGWIDRRNDIIKAVKEKIRTNPSMSDVELLEAIQQKWTCTKRTALDYFISAKIKKINWETKEDEDKWLNLSAKDREDYEKEKQAQKLTEVKT